MKGPSMPHPSTVPIDKWPQGWCALECANILDDSKFLMASIAEKEERGWPVSLDEMRQFIKADRNQ